MSDTNNDTSAIDEKKGNSLSDTTSIDMSKITSFLTSVITVLILVLAYFSGSAIVLFICKLAQSNILPTDARCAPYTETNPSITPNPIKTNIFTTFSDPEMSMKLEIPYNINSEHKLINILKVLKDSAGFLGNYLVSIIDSLMEFNYWTTSTTFSAMNETLPEIFFVLFGPIFAGIMYFLGFILNAIMFAYLWFANMKWFFKTNTNKSGSGAPKWEDVTLIGSPFNWFAGLCLAILFSYILLFGGIFIIPVVFFIYTLTMLTLCFYKGTMNGKKVLAFSMIPELLKHYKITITSVISVFVVLLAFSKLGTIPGIVSIITVVLIYSGYVTMNLYKPVSETGFTPSVSYKQAKKICNARELLGKKHGPIYNFFFGQSGGGLTREIKNINRKLA